MNVLYQRWRSPAGLLVIASQGDALCAVAFESIWRIYRNRFSNVSEGASPVIEKAKHQLEDYFKGRRKVFDLPLAFHGTDFQNKVWKALARIPYGQTQTYAQQARAIRSPKAIRAVGRTHGLNPFCIVLPCHRVIGSNGSLTGYAGGLSAKRSLLQLEGVTV
jgi:methylated-DNA-[protein]-cysteine S-methyltransferase